MEHNVIPPRIYGSMLLKKLTERNNEYFDKLNKISHQTV